MTGLMNDDRRDQIIVTAVELLLLLTSAVLHFVVKPKTMLEANIVDARNRLDALMDQEFPKS